MTYYVVTFIGKNKQILRRSLFASAKEAKECLESYLADTSNKYRNISILNLNQTIEDIILFDNNGKVCARFREGDVVQIKPEWMSSPEEAKYYYSVHNIHEEFERCTICCLNSTSILGSSETVGLDMIQLAKTLPSAISLRK